MRIEELNQSSQNGFQRVSARFIFEDTSRDSMVVYYETPETYENVLKCDIHAFVSIGLVCAQQFSEKRLKVSEPLCPVFRKGILSLLKVFNKWYPDLPAIPELNDGASNNQPDLVNRSRSFVFLSGGVDSLDALRRNQICYSENHPWRVVTGVFVHGFDFGGKLGRGDHLVGFDRARRALKPVLDDTRISLLPIYTNLRHLDDGLDFWLKRFHGAGLASVAHVLSANFSRGYLGSSHPVESLVPFGSHPITDPLFSSASMQIVHDSVENSRLDKTKLLAEWGPALKSLRVCGRTYNSTLNCGQCEKCVRTMLALLALGKLEEADAFSESDVSPELLRTVDISVSPNRIVFYRELIPMLTERGRSDLVNIIESGFQGKKNPGVFEHKFSDRLVSLCRRFLSGGR